MNRDVLLGTMKKVLEIDSGDGHNIVNVLNAAELKT